MFKDINVSANDRNLGSANANFQNTNELVSGIGAIVQGWLDPQVSPEVREMHFRECLIAREAFVNAGFSEVVRLYSVELPTEEVKIIPGIFYGGEWLFYVDGDLLIPVPLGQRLFEKEKTVGRGHKRYPRIRLISWSMLGR